MRSVENGVEVLLLHKPRKKDSWQLPQGGVDGGESIEEAALRELKEEAGIGANLLGKSQTVYQYDFPSSYRRFRPDNVCGQRLEFVIGVVEPEIKITVDNDEIDDYVWASLEDIGKHIKRKEYLDVIRKLVSEGKKLVGSV